MTPREYVLDVYRREAASVLNRDHRDQPSRWLAFAAARDDLARQLARDVAANLTMWDLHVEAFRIVDGIVCRQDERIHARWRAERDGVSA